VVSEAVYVIGDVHGQLPKLIHILTGAGLVDPANLWLLGDFFDRGPSGIGVVDLIMRLQQEATAVGGAVGALLGNHDIGILGAAHLGTEPISPDETFLADWQRNGGVLTDLAGLTPRHIAWLHQLPALALVGERLLLHADALLYTRYGATIVEINAAFAAMLAERDPLVYARLLNEFAERDAFRETTPGGPAMAARLLAQWGGRQLIHGHTPISKQTGQLPATVTEPLIYAGGLCVNVDGGMYLGGPGFVYRLPALD
jgi:hypothetical protein